MRELRVWTSTIRNFPRLVANNSLGRRRLQEVATVFRGIRERASHVVERPHTSFKVQEMGDCQCLSTHCSRADRFLDGYKNLRLLSVTWESLDVHP
jgi:hypothetical protein